VSNNQDGPVGFLQSKIVDLLRPKGQSIKLAKGEKLCSIGDSSKLIHIIESGKIKLVVQRGGQPAVVRRSTFGFLSEGVMLGLPCQFDAIAERRTLLFAIPRDVLSKLISEQADILEGWNLAYPVCCQ
jgi:CRP-like cAMP-binding protein